MHKENKITTLFNNSSPLQWRHFGEYHICKQHMQHMYTDTLLRSDQSINTVNSVSAYVAVDTEQHTFFTYVMPGGDKLLNKVVIFVFFAHKKYSHSFVKLWL